MSEITRTEQKNDNLGQTIIINQQKKETNGTGIAGFVLSIIALFLGWIPILGWILWFAGLILSIIGLFKKPKGLAIAGLIISLLGIILLIFLFTGFAILGGMAS
jgi:hypothetical protein